MWQPRLAAEAVHVDRLLVSKLRQQPEAPEDNLAVVEDIHRTAGVPRWRAMVREPVPGEQVRRVAHILPPEPELLIQQFLATMSHLW